MTLLANGPFEVKLNPESLSAVAEQSGLGRMSLDKQYHGDLEAVSHGEMLAFRSSVQAPPAMWRWKPCKVRSAAATAVSSCSTAPP